MTAFSRAQHYLDLGEAEEARLAKPAVNLMIAVSAGVKSEATPCPCRLLRYRFGLKPSYEKSAQAPGEGRREERK